MESARDLLRRILERRAKAAERAGRDPKSVTLLAVTKTVPLERVLPFIEAGIHHIGENRLQEALTKYSGLRTRDSESLTMHLIGPLQSNKAKKAAGFFDVIQTLDRWELAEDLNRHAGELGKVLDCLVQIKISDEPTKSGLDSAALPEFISRVATLPHLKIRGLMGIPPLTATGDASRPYFARLRKLFENAKLNVLSMGMSSDFEIAIEEGSTLVRLGTALFGSRTADA